jgi:hypothetical protein
MNVQKLLWRFSMSLVSVNERYLLDYPGAEIWHTGETDGGTKVGAMGEGSQFLFTSLDWSAIKSSATHMNT